MAQTPEKPIGMTAKPTRPQEFYDSVKRKFAEERDLRLNYRPQGTAQFTSDLTGDLSKYEVDPYGGEVKPRAPLAGGVGARAPGPLRLPPPTSSASSPVSLPLPLPTTPLSPFCIHSTTS